MPEPDEVLPLAQKLIGLAREQRSALERGAREQYRWIALRRDEVTDKLSTLLAAGTLVPGHEAGQLHSLRSELIEIDRAIEGHLRSEMSDLARRRRTFARNRKAVGSYLQVGPRRGFLDTQR